MQKTLTIIGVGQRMRGDDAAGLEIVQRWLAQIAPAAAPGIPFQLTGYAQWWIRVHLAELPGLALLDLLTGCDAAILADAVHSGRPPGAVHLIDEKQLAAFAPGSESAHGWGVAETLRLGRKIQPETLPASLWIIGVEAGDFDAGAPLSPPVAAALPAAAELLQSTVARVLADGSHPLQP